MINEDKLNRELSLLIFGLSSAHRSLWDLIYSYKEDIKSGLITQDDIVKRYYEKLYEVKKLENGD